MGQRDVQIVALKAAGRSIRDIAAEVGLSKSQVQRVLSAEGVALEGAGGVDPQVADLSARELAYLGFVNAAGKPYRPIKLNALQEYRLQAVFSFRAAGRLVPKRKRRVGPMTKFERDAEILRLRKLGWTFAAIGQALRPKIETSTVQRIVGKLEEDGIVVEDDDEADGWDWDDEDIVDEQPVEIVPVVRRPQRGAVGRRRQGWRDGNA